MARNLIVSNEQTQTPSSPVIVANLASLPGGVEVFANTVEEDYPGGVINEDGIYYPKVLKAGHLIYHTYAEGWTSAGIEEGEMIDSRNFGDGDSDVVGILTADTPVYFDENKNPKAICSVMLAGIVDAAQCPAKLGNLVHKDNDGLYTGVNHIVVLNRD